MKILSIILLFMSSLYSFSIDFNKEFEKSLKPNSLRVFLDIVINKRDEKSVLKLLAQYSKYIDGFKELDIKGGEYSIHPKLKYENGKSYKDGYIGQMHYVISSKQSNDINSFIYKIQNSKKDKESDITISNVNWYIEEKDKKAIYDLLRLDAIKWGLQYAKDLSKSLSFECSIKKISFSSANYYPTPKPALRTLNISVAPTPKADLQYIQINPHFDMECR